MLYISFMFMLRFYTLLHMLNAVLLFENIRFNKNFHDRIKIFDLERKQSKLNQIKDIL